MGEIPTLIVGNDTSEFEHISRYAPLQTTSIIIPYSNILTLPHLDTLVSFHKSYYNNKDLYLCSIAKCTTNIVVMTTRLVVN